MSDARADAMAGTNPVIELVEFMLRGLKLAPPNQTWNFRQWKLAPLSDSQTAESER